MESVTTSPFPMTIATNGYRDNAFSLQNADALLVHANMVSNGHLGLQHCIGENSKSNAVSLLENRFQAERQTRALEAQAERLERENQRVVQLEHEKTRDVIRAMAREQAMDARLARIEAALSVRTPV